jgi:hypothetical protein
LSIVFNKSVLLAQYSSTLLASNRVACCRHAFSKALSIAPLRSSINQGADFSEFLQPLSSQYFIEETGEMKIMKGVRKFLEEDNVEVEGLEPAIDSAAFSLTAWQQFSKVLYTVT